MDRVKRMKIQDCLDCLAVVGQFIDLILCLSVQGKRIQEYELAAFAFYQRRLCPDVNEASDPE